MANSLQPTIPGLNRLCNIILVLLQRLFVSSGSGRQGERVTHGVFPRKEQAGAVPPRISKRVDQAYHSCSLNLAELIRDQFMGIHACILGKFPLFMHLMEMGFALGSFRPWKSLAQNDMVDASTDNAKQCKTIYFFSG